MATLERLVRALEILKVFQPDVSQAESAKKKEVVITGRDKAVNCNIIADCICSQNLRNVADFPKFLGIAMETFLLMCDDKESDVRMAADECLNRSIKTLLETNLGRLQVELYKEIKKNGASRSLRSSLSRFADMCHLIRPQKCRPYVVNLLPCISRICKRDEEAIQETLATAMQKLCPVLMGFTNDNEVKLLLKAFIPNIKSSSATCRRTAAASLTLICQECRKPPTFFAWLVNVLLENVIPVSEATPSHTLLGVLLTLRHIMPHLSTSAEQEDSLRDSFGAKTKQEQVTISTQQLVQIYELLLYYTKHDDHNVVTASLETLQQMLKTAPQALLKVLTTKGSISSTLIYEQDQLLGRGRSGSQSGRLPSTSDDTGLDEDLDLQVGLDSVSAEDSSSVLTDLDQSDLECPSLESINASSDLSREREDGEMDEPDVFVTTDDYTNIEIGVVTDKSERSEKSYPATMSQSSSADTLSDMKNISPSHHQDSLKIGVPEDVNDSSSNRSVDMDISESAPTSKSSTQGSVLREGDIGLITDAQVPLVHGVRLLCSRFLLTGYPMGLIPDRQVRVSLKSLALGCVSSAALLCPETFVVKMHKSSPIEGDLQDVKDVLLYSNHNDPQLKGNTAILIGNFIHAVLTLSRGNYTNWAQQYQQHSKVELEELVERLSILMEDESSVALRLGLIALKSCIVDILGSYHSYIGIKLLLVLLRVRNNSYWLVKVELCELLSLVDFKLVSFLEEQCVDLRKGQHHYTGKLELQKHMIDDVILSLLSDEDGRVRHAAASALIGMIPKFFFPVDTPQHDPVIAKAEEFASGFLDPILHEWSQAPQPLVHSLVKPFHQTERFHHSPIIESSLSRLVHLLSSSLNKSTSRYFTYGICHSLCQLCEVYPVTQYPGAWGCAAGGRDTQLTHRRTSSASRITVTGPSSPGLAKNFSALTMDELALGNSSGCLPTILSILTSTPIVMDISAHQDVLTLACNLFAGAALKCLRNPHDASKTKEDGRWVSLSDRSLVPLADALLAHIAKMLNICAHVIDDQSLGPPQTKSTLPSLPNAPSISPIKRKAKGIKDEVSEKINSPSDEKKKDKGKSSDKGDKEKDSEKQKNAKDGLGSVHNLPHYTKIFDTLKGAYSNYMISLELGSGEKFGSLLQTVLRSFSQLLEIASLKEIGPHAEEFLGYLKSTVAMEPTTAILCVQQLLKALFGTNMASQWESSSTGNTSRKPGKATRLTACTRPGLYHSCFTTPYTQLTQCLASATFKATTHAAAVSTPDSDETTSILGWLRKRTERKIPAVLKSGTKADKSSIASYIRLFEPLVIKALKQYTVTSSLGLQQQVLNLLAQLVQLRVNYCLLDSDQIFIGFVIKQFEFIEEGQIRNSESLIPHIFNFLVLLSYERYHSKSIISMPKIIQLCDGIMASGQHPTTHAIPALQPIVHDLFVLRAASKSESSKDLETQREVVVSMLLRLLQYHQVLEMFIIVLHQYHRESEEKWKRLSRQIIDLLLPMLAKQQVNLDCQVSVDVVHRLFEAVAPSVFRPVDFLLKTLFAAPDDLSWVGGLQRWISMVLIILRVIVAQSKEEVVLSRLHELGLGVLLFTDTMEKHRTQQPTHTDPLEVNANLPHMETAANVPPQNVIARLLLQIIGVAAAEINQQSCSLLHTNASALQFLCQELAHLLLYVTHMFQSGLYRHVAKSAMSMIQQSPETPSFFSVQQLNELFKQLAFSQPTLTLQWCNVLILLNYDNQSWWSEILQTPTKYIMSSPSRESCDVVSSPPVRLCCSADILRRGGLILFCDYVCENLNDAEHMTWVIINHVGDLIELSHEPPVQDFISAIHRNSAASGLFIQAINSRFENLNKVCSVKKTLHALEAIHMSQSGTLLTLLVDKFLHTNHLAVARLCDMIACRRVEMLLAENVQECSSQLPLEDLEKLLHFMKTNRLTKRHGRLASLLTKLRNLMCSESKLTLSPERTHPLALTTTGINDIKVNKEWFISITREQCFNSNASPRECASMLAHMDYCAMLNIIMAQEFRFSILPECVSLGTLRTLVKFREFTARELSQQNDPAGVGHSPFKATSADPLLQAAQITLFRHINNIINMLPVPHQLVNYKGKLNSNEEQYRTNMEDLFTDGSWVDMVTHLLATLVQYLLSLPRLPWQPDVPDESLKDVARFSLLGLEMIHWQFEQDQLPSSENMSTVLQCFCLTLQKNKLSNVFAEQSQTTWVCSAIRAVHQILSSLMVLPGERLVRLIHQDSQDDMAASIVGSFDEFHHAVRACDQISELVHCLRTRLNPHDPSSCSLPGFLTGSLRTVIIGLARLPLVNSYARTPPLVWKLGWMPSPSGDMRTRLPPLPLDYLQEKDVLKEFIYRVNVLGWTSRQQFEETWMSLLGVLNPVSMGDEEHHLSPEEEMEQVQTSVLAMRGIISLLVQSTMTPKPGNPSNSTCDHRPRDKSLIFLHTRHDKDGSQHYLSLKWETEEKGLMLDHNAERQLGAYNFGLGQICVESMWGLLGMLDMNQLLEEAADDSESTSTGTDPSPGSPEQVYPSLQQIELSNMERKERASAVSGLDIHSCLQFLLEQFGQFLAPNASPRVPLMQLNETIKSVLYLSDLFTEQQQFQWMLDKFLEVQRNHPQEDELITQYVVVGVCKAAAIVGIDSATSERLVKLIDACLKSTHLPCKVCTLFGSLYILEAGMSDITHQIIPMVTDCVLRQVSSITPATIVSDQFVMVIWSTSFFLIENYQEEIRETDFTSKVLQMAINNVSSEDSFPLSIYQMIMRSLERLILAGVLSQKDSELLVKLAVDRIQVSNPQRSLAALGLMLTCMYAGKQGDEWSPTDVMNGQGYAFFSDGAQDPESLIVAMERVTLLFERIRKGFPYEARVITRVLPTFLADFFPPQDIMNKVIGEFLSNQQPHPQLMARVVFQVFEKLLEKGQTDLVRDWVMLSLSNFTQRTPVSMAIWSLTCFFISASTNSWLRALFPHVIGRMGSLDVVDQRLFCISALDFRTQLHMRPDEQRAFKAAFQAVAQPQTPYAELLALCS